MAKKKSVHYVDNKKFLQAMIDWRETWPDEENIPPVTNYIGECFLKIATHLSYRPNFINYTYRDEMISDGIENCLQYVKNFNPEKSKNPFAYFTQIIYYAFLRRIAKEKKQSHIKNKMIEREAYNSFTTMEGDSNTYQVDNIDLAAFLPDEDVYKPKKKQSTKKKGLEVFMEKED
jgi:DNA-directed RNA polymerase specialized sigma24 family protein|tara:strand:+ start:76 stop:600 length:525 start_codon:yes stop_codon:yes gene_type:complete